MDKSMEEKLVGPWPSHISVSQCLDHRHISVSESETGHSAGSYLWLREPTQIFARSNPDICENQTKIFARTKPKYLKEPSFSGVALQQNITVALVLIRLWWEVNGPLTIFIEEVIEAFSPVHSESTVRLQWVYSEFTVGAIWSISFPILHNHLRRGRWPNKQATKVGHFLGV